MRISSFKPSTIWKKIRSVWARKRFERRPGGIRTYHLTHSRDRARSSLGIVKTPRHLLLYCLEGRLVQVLRFVHDEQDLGAVLADV
jgi:hypothetical protein